MARALLDDDVMNTEQPQADRTDLNELTEAELAEVQGGFMVEDFLRAWDQYLDRVQSGLIG